MAFNKKELARGILQIRPVMVREVNSILGHKKYKPKDAYNKTKALEMWYIIQKHHNPTYDLKRMCLVWNGVPNKKNASRSKDYYKKVQRELKKLL